MYYIVELEMSIELKEKIESIIAKENLSLEDYLARCLSYYTLHSDELERIQKEYNALSENEKETTNSIRVIRIYPVADGETENDARERAIRNENEQHLLLPELSVEELHEHIEDDDFPVKFGNPVIINCYNGKKLVCITLPLFERMLRQTGQDDKADEINRIAEGKEQTS